MQKDKIWVKPIITLKVEDKDSRENIMASIARLVFHLLGGHIGTIIIKRSDKNGIRS